MDFTNDALPEKIKKESDIDAKIVQVSHSISKIDSSLQTKKEILRAKISKTYNKIESTRRNVNARIRSNNTPSPRRRYSPSRAGIETKKIEDLEQKLEETIKQLNRVKNLFSVEKGKLGRTISSQRLRILKLEKENQKLREQLLVNSNVKKNISTRDNSEGSKRSSQLSAIGNQGTNHGTASPTKYIIIRKQE